MFAIIAWHYFVLLNNMKQKQLIRDLAAAGINLKHIIYYK